MPFVHAVYGTSVYTFPDANKTFNLYVTTSGFMLEPETPGEAASAR
jgi:hypothetical protein